MADDQQIKRMSIEDIDRGAHGKYAPLRKVIQAPPQILFDIAEALSLLGGEKMSVTNAPSVIA
jgi:hypothetical protein